MVTDIIALMVRRMCANKSLNQTAKAARFFEGVSTLWLLSPVAWLVIVASFAIGGVLHKCVGFNRGYRRAAG